MTPSRLQPHVWAITLGLGVLLLGLILTLDHGPEIAASSRFFWSMVGGAALALVGLGLRERGVTWDWRPAGSASPSVNEAARDEPAHAPETVERRLAHVEELLARGTLTLDEAAEARAQILRDL